MNKNWLVEDWNNYDPTDDLADIMTGKFLSAISSLPQSLKQLIQEGDLHVQVKEVDGRYQVTKIVKKREPEFLQGTEKYYIYDKYGKRIPITEQEYDRYLLIGHNPEDVYNNTEVELETLNSQSVAPMDTWDLTFDATSYLQQAMSFVDAWNQDLVDRKQTPDPHKVIEELQEDIYSADWFPYSTDKRLHNRRAKKIAQKILLGEIVTKQQLAIAIGRKQKDERQSKAFDMQQKAAEMPSCPAKAKLIVQAQKLMSEFYKDQKKNRLMGIQEDIGQEDRGKLWAIWRQEKIKQDGSVQLMPWQFERIYRLKLQKRIVRNEITHKDAERQLREKMKKLFSKASKTKLGNELLKKNQELDIPEWLKNISPPLLEESEENYEFQHTDWLPNEFQNSENTIEEEFEQEYINSLLNE